MDRFGFVVDRCGSFWVILGRFGWLLVLVTTFSTNLNFQELFNGTGSVHLMLSVFF